MQKKPELISFSALPGRELTKLYRSGLEKIKPAVLTLTEAQADRQFPESTAGIWSCRVLLAHIADAEIAFAHRMRRAVSEKKPGFAVWDEIAFIEAGLYKSASLSESIDLIQATRKWTGAWLSTLSDEQYLRTGIHPEKGEQTVQGILAYTTWHLENHTWFLDQKLELLAAAK